MTALPSGVLEDKPEMRNAYPVVKDFRDWMIKSIKDYPEGVASCELTGEDILTEYIIVPTSMDGHDREDIEDFGFVIGDAAGPYFVFMQLYEEQYKGATDGSGSMTQALRECGEMWRDMKKTHVGTSISCSAGANIGKYRPFFDMMIEENAESVLGVKLKDLKGMYGNLVHAADQLHIRGKFNGEDFKQSLFIQAFVGGVRMKGKQISWMEKLPKEAKEGKKKKEAAVTSSKGKPDPKYIARLFLDMDKVSFGRGGTDFYNSLREFFIKKSFLSEKQLFHLEKMHYRFRGQHKFAEAAEAEYIYYDKSKK